MADWRKILVVATITGSFSLGLGLGSKLATAQEATPSTPAPVQDAALDEEGDIENLMSVQGEVTATDPKANTVAIKDGSVKDPATASKTLVIDPKTTTIWGEYDEIKLTDLPVGSKVAGEYKLNPNGSMTATYLEIVLDEEAELPALEETPEDAQANPAEKPVE